MRWWALPFLLVMPVALVLGGWLLGRLSNIVDGYPERNWMDRYFKGQLTGWVFIFALLGFFCSGLLFLAVWNWAFQK